MITKLIFHLLFPLIPFTCWRSSRSEGPPKRLVFCEVPPVEHGDRLAVSAQPAPQAQTQPAATWLQILILQLLVPPLTLGYFCSSLSS